MRLTLAAVLLAVAAPLAASADPGACATTINSKGVETTVCDPTGGGEGDRTCYAQDPGYELRPLPYVRACYVL